MKHKSSNRFFRSLSPGHVWSVDYGFYRHMALETLNGTMISNSRSNGGILETSKEEFADGRPVTNEGYLGDLCPVTVEKRARSMSDRNYDLFTFNCEHFVRYAHGVREVSPQIGKAALFTALGIALFVWIRRKTA